MELAIFIMSENMCYIRAVVKSKKRYVQTVGRILSCYLPKHNAGTVSVEQTLVGLETALNGCLGIAQHTGASSVRLACSTTAAAAAFFGGRRAGVMALVPVSVFGLMAVPAAVMTVAAMLLRLDSAAPRRTAVFVFRRRRL